MSKESTSEAKSSYSWQRKALAIGLSGALALSAGDLAKDKYDSIRHSYDEVHTFSDPKVGQKVVDKQIDPDSVTRIIVQPGDTAYGLGQVYGRDNDQRQNVADELSKQDPTFKPGDVLYAPLDQLVPGAPRQIPTIEETGI